MTAPPPVSVVIIFFNPGRFLGEAVASVFAQRYDQWELVLVDDGSTDGSSSSAEQLALEHPTRVRYLSHPGRGNRGMSASRNLGARAAVGEMIAFLDADDVWYPNALAEQVAILSANDEAGAVYGPIEWWYGWTGQTDDLRRDFVREVGAPADQVIHPPRLLPLWLQNKAMVPSGLLLRKSAIERVGGFEEHFRGLYEDQAFLAKLCLDVPIYVSSQCWYRYRQHPASACNVEKGRGRYHAARPAFLGWLTEYLSRRGVQDPAVWRAVDEELWPYRHPVLHRVLRSRDFVVDRLTSATRKRPLRRTV